jgi:nucleotide-binding universal stress UspA family protein
MKNDGRTVLLTVDLDDKTLVRLERSYVNLKDLAGRVVLLYVLENLQHISSEEDKKAMVKEKDTLLNKLAEDIRSKTGAEVRPVMQKGKAAEEILNAAESYNADLIIMSTHTHPEDDHTQKHTIGVTTSRVVRESKVPVFTFNSNVHLKRIKKILLPLDLTVETRQKVTNAIEMALLFNASIHVVSVLWSTKIEEIKEELLQQLEQVRNFIREDNIECTTHLIVAEGNSSALATSVLKYANEIGADLIMIMTQQETKLAQFFLGSSAQTIIRLSNVPVMSIIPKDLGI